MLKRILKYYLPLLIVSLLFCVWMFFEERKSVAEAERVELVSKKQLTVELLNPVIANIYYWSRHNFDEKDFDSISSESSFLADMSDFVLGMNQYSQFRIIDNNGQELLRLVREENGSIFQDSLLQNKSNRGYFKKTIALDKGEIYLSPLNLNIENEEIEKPYNPMIRGSAAIYSKNKQKLGIVVINYKAEKLLELLNEDLDNSFFILNKDGHYLSNSENKEHEFSHLIKLTEPKGFYSENSEIWEVISNASESEFYNNGIWVSNTLDFDESLSGSSIIGNKFAEIVTDNEWLLVSHVRNSQIFYRISDFLLVILLLNILILLIVIYIARVEVASVKLKKQYLYKLKKRKETLEKKNVLLTTIRDRLELRNRQLKEYNNIVAHNLRAPTTSMSALVSMVNKTDDYEEMKIYLPKLNTITKNINTLVSDLLVYVRILNDNKIEIEKVNIEPIIQHTLGLFTETIDQEVIDVEIDLSGWKSVMFSKIYLQSVLQNLISNAIKYRDPEKESFIKIKTLIRDDKYILEISDNGLGIDTPALEEEIFKLYRRFHRDISGKGMGLFLVKTQLESLNATIEVEGKKFIGTKFIITFSKKINEYDIFPN